MCLVNSVKSVKELLGTKKKIFKFYKIVIKLEYTFGLRSLHRYNYIWKVGVNLSSSRARKPRLRNDGIDHGIHVFRKLESAQRHSDVSRILEVICNKADLLGANETEAVFRKVRVSRKAYKDALR